MNNIEKATLIELLKKYITIGIIKGGELCLPKDKALGLLNELEMIGVGVLGLDGWSYIDKDKKIIAQNLDVDVSIDKTMIAAQDYVVASLSIARENILYRLPQGIDFISFTLDIPYLWKELFPITER